MKQRPRAIGRPRKIIARAGIFLLLVSGGAIVNIAVAWGCIACSDVATRRSWSDGAQRGFMTGDEQSHLFVARRFGHERIALLRYRVGRIVASLPEQPVADHLPSWSTLSKASEAYVNEAALGDAGQEEASGWPAYSLRCRYIYDCADLTQPGMPFTLTAVRYGYRLPKSLAGIPLESPTRRAPVLPWMPIWPGFAINTLFYAAILWLLFAAPFALRHWRRLKRGLCPVCAYPVGTSDLCTECGDRVHHRLG